MIRLWESSVLFRNKNHNVTVYEKSSLLVAFLEFIIELYYVNMSGFDCFVRLGILFVFVTLV